MTTTSKCSASTSGSTTSRACGLRRQHDDRMTFFDCTAGAGVRQATRSPDQTKAVTLLKEHIVEVISDSGEGAQRCGQALGAIAAKMGNGVWTVEIIPAEIRPPARSVAGASGNRIRIGAGPVTNGGDETGLVMAFNEQVLLGRVRAGELRPIAAFFSRACGASFRIPRSQQRTSRPTTNS